MKFEKKMFLLIWILIWIMAISGCANQPTASANVSADNTDEFKASVTESAATIDSVDAAIISEDYENETYTNTDALALDENSDNDGIYTDGFSFKYNGVIIYLGEHTERILNELEPASDFYESQSCSFDGMAKIYYYNGFEISTYLKNKTDKDRVYSIIFIDDSVATTEGIYIGQTFDDMVAVYGSDYKDFKEIPGLYKYEKIGTSLAFDISDNIITSISYEVIDIYN